MQPDRLDPELTAEGDPRDAAQITEGAQAEEVEVAALILVERQALDRERLQEGGGVFHDPGRARQSSNPSPSSPAKLTG